MISKPKILTFLVMFILKNQRGYDSYLRNSSCILFMMENKTRVPIFITSAYIPTNAVNKNVSCLRIGMLEIILSLLEMIVKMHLETQ